MKIRSENLSVCPHGVCSSLSVRPFVVKIHSENVVKGCRENLFVVKICRENVVKCSENVVKRCRESTKLVVKMS